MRQVSVLVLSTETETHSIAFLLLYIHVHCTCIEMHMCSFIRMFLRQLLMNLVNNCTVCIEQLLCTIDNSCENFN